MIVCRFKEVRMKHFIKKLCVIGLLTLSSTSIMAKPMENIFPAYTGMSATVVSEGAMLYTYPDAHGDCLTVTDTNALHIVGQNSDWYKVALEDTTGWINKEDVHIQNSSYVPYSKVLGEEIVDYGKQFIGTPYVWGGNDLKKGVDCSGLTKEVFETFDINITRLASTQVKDGKIVDKSELRPGDLSFLIRQVKTQEGFLMLAFMQGIICFYMRTAQMV